MPFIEDGEGSDDSGSHNESTQPLEEVHHSPCDCGPADDGDDEPTKKLKKFWSRFKVPKFSGSAAASSPENDDCKKEEPAASSADDDRADAADAPEFESVHSPGSESSDEIDQVMREIDPSWKGGSVEVTHKGGRSLFEARDRFNARFLPNTPDIQPLWDDIGRDSSCDGSPARADDQSEDGSCDGSPTKADDRSEDGSEFYNPEGKAEDLPPCAKFGIEDLCEGRDCQACQAAMDGADEPNGVMPSSFALADICQRKPSKKRKARQSSSSSTLKTPPSKRPDFFGAAVVDTPEKVTPENFAGEEAG